MTNYAVTGSTGYVGGQVARLVAHRRPRLVVRDAARAPHLEGATVAQASYGDREASLAALQGIDVLFMVSAAESRTRRAEHRTFIRAAAEAGVRHVVYTSFQAAAPDATFTLGRDHFDAEEAIRETGLAYTFLRDNLYLDFVPAFADEHGVIRGPAGEGRFAGVARGDVAEVAATVLGSPADHAGAAYELTGPEAITLGEAAARASAALGRALRFETETLDDAYSSRRAAYPDVEDWQLDAWVSTYTAIRNGELAQVSGDVHRILGRAPRALEDVLTPQS